MILQKKRALMYPLFIIVGNSGHGKVLPRTRGFGHTLLRGKTAVFVAWLRCIVLKLQQKFGLLKAPE